jgi:hypothetical protein
MKLNVKQGIVIVVGVVYAAGLLIFKANTVSIPVNIVWLILLSLFFAVRTNTKHP